MRIPLWWIILLSMITIALPNGTFWEIASFSILVVASVIAIFRWYGERNRQNKLIYFPYSKWSANYDKNKNVVRVQINVNALINFHAYQFGASIFANGKSIHLQNVDSGQPIINKEGRIFLSGEIPMSEIPKGITELEIQGNIMLDGAIKKSSGKRKVTITDLNLLESHKEDSR